MWCVRISKHFSYSVVNPCRLLVFLKYAYLLSSLYNVWLKIECIRNLYISVFVKCLIDNNCLYSTFFEIHIDKNIDWYPVSLLTYKVRVTPCSGQASIDFRYDYFSLKAKEVWYSIFNSKKIRSQNKNLTVEILSVFLASDISIIIPW